MDLFKKDTFTLTGTAYCDGIDLGGRPIMLIEAPDALTSTLLNVKTSIDGTVYKTLYNDDGTAYTVTIAAGQMVKINPVDFSGVPFVQFGPGSDESTNVRTFHYVLSTL